MRSKPLLFLLLPVLLFCLDSCKSGNNTFTVIGNIDDMPVQKITLEELNANDAIIVTDSATSTDKGKFELSGTATEPGLYRLHFNQNRYILLSVDKGNLKVTGNWNMLENYKVSGSPSSESLRKFMAVIREHLRDFNSMSIVIDTLQKRTADSVNTAKLSFAKKDFQDMRVHFTEFIEHYADTTNFLPNAVFAARILNPVSEKSYLDIFTQSLDKRFPNTRMGKDFESYYARINSNKTKMPQQPRRVPASGGGIAADLKLATPNGKLISLSSLRGQYVLLDFWASWCAPCRAENPNVLAAYNKYKGKNFTIYSVSLDNNREAWINAIKQDQLPWIHVSDLKGWQSDAAKTYNIESIPSNFLIDPNGKIIAQNLKGDALEDQLKKTLK